MKRLICLVLIMALAAPTVSFAKFGGGFRSSSFRSSSSFKAPSFKPGSSIRMKSSAPKMVSPAPKVKSTPSYKSYNYGTKTPSNTVINNNSGGGISSWLPAWMMFWMVSGDKED